MAGVADSHVVFTKGDMQGLVGIAVTAETVGHFKMGLAFVAHGALRDHRAFFDSGRMLGGMAVKTADFRSMLAAVIHVLMDDLAMTFYTVAVCQYRVFRPCVLRNRNESDSQKHDCRKNVLSHDSSPLNTFCVENGNIVPASHAGMMSEQ
jgi:hypothetical protein